MIWRLATDTDIRWANEVSTSLHPQHPEDDEVFENRYHFYPRGFAILEINGEPQGYAVAHPWNADSYPHLNTVINRLPKDSSILHVHDVGILPESRSIKALKKLMNFLEEVSIHENFEALQAIALAKTTRLWRRFGFFNLLDDKVESEYGIGAKWMRKEHN